MELFTRFIDLFIHLGEHLNWAIQNYDVWTYLLLFLIIFCETGLVVTPIVPIEPSQIPIVTGNMF